VSMRNRRLLALSVMNRRPESVVQTFAAADVCFSSVPAWCKSRAWYSAGPDPGSAGDNSTKCCWCRLWRETCQRSYLVSCCGGQCLMEGGGTGVLWSQDGYTGL
jgi:hypothetical protein